MLVSFFAALTVILFAFWQWDHIESWFLDISDKIENVREVEAIEDQLVEAAPLLIGALFVAAIVAILTQI